MNSNDMQVLLSRVGFFGSKDDSNSDNVKNYRKTAEAIMCNILPKSPKASDSRTESNISTLLLWPFNFLLMKHLNILHFHSFVRTTYLTQLHIVRLDMYEATTT